MGIGEKNFGNRNDDENVKRGKFVISDAVNGIFSAIGNADKWPQSAKDWMIKLVAEKEIEQVIEELVKGSAKGGHYGLGDATEDEIKLVIALVENRKAEFAGIVKKNFVIGNNEKSIFE